MARPLALFILSLAFCGCMKSLEEQAKKSDKSIIGKTNQDVGEFDPNAGKKVSDSKVKVTNPVTAGLEAYGPMLEQINKVQVKQAVDLFHASNDRYPKDHAEFMEQIIKANNIRLPVLPGGKNFEYDVEKHELVVVEGDSEQK